MENGLDVELLFMDDRSRDRHCRLFPQTRPVPDGFADRFETRIFLRTEARSSEALNRLLESPGDCGVPAMVTEGRALSRCAYDSATMSLTTR